MTFIVTLRFQAKREIHERSAASMKIDGKGNLILYDKGRRIIENLTLAELSDLSIEHVHSRAARGAI